MNVSWTRFANGTAICGVPKNGADAIANLDGINFALDQCLKVSNLLIFDGVMVSKKLVEYLHHHPANVAALWVFLDVTAATVVSRLSERRLESGKSEPSHDTIRGVLNFRTRARVLWEYAKASYVRAPAKFVVIPEGRTPDQIHRELNEHVQQLMAAGEMQLQEPECA
ncbi:MAG TPA: hypothetical protein VFO39_17645 [Candidatus Sulfotelmatobacter sp.]|nr:hypothetical protein [Candidatus Sulfotelmatobacter sp.]